MHTQPGYLQATVIGLSLLMNLFFIFLYPAQIRKERNFYKDQADNWRERFIKYVSDAKTSKEIQAGQAGITRGTPPDGLRSDFGTTGTKQ